MTSDPAGPLTVKLDELLTSREARREYRAFVAGLPLEGRREAEVMKRRVAEIEAQARERVGRAGRSVSRVAPGRTPEWVRLGALNALAAWLSGTARTCGHVPAPNAPFPLVACAWKPGLVVCVACTSSVSAGLSARQDATCDGCGKVTAGPDAGDPIFPGALVFGCVTFFYGTCTGCRFIPDGDVTR
jgi:hypothetical protein